MKKIFALLITAVLALTAAFGFAACGGLDPKGEKNIIIGASSTPHAEILEHVKGDLEKLGYKVEIKVYGDYVLPNTDLEDGTINANYFQHEPYLNDFNKENGTHLVSVFKPHYEPFGLYGKNVSKSAYEASEKTGKKIYIPNDGSNGTRALLLLQQEGFITLKAGANGNDVLTESDIVDKNGNNIQFATASNVYSLLNNDADGTLAVINGNYALEAGLSVKNDAIAVEDASGDAAQLYANLIAVKAGEENSEKTKAIISVLKSQKVIDFINSKYDGAVLPAFELG